MDAPPVKPAEPAPLARPWATGLFVVLALGVAAWPGAAAALGLVRDRVYAGEIWRLWTGHLVHYSLSHLGWNLLVIVVSGTWCERVAPATTRWFFLVAPPFVGGLVLGLEPGLDSYAGASALATGLPVLLSLRQIFRPECPDRRFWRFILIVVLAKVAWETWGQGGSLANFGRADVRPVPIAHLAGTLAAVALALGTRSRGARAKP